MQKKFRYHKNLTMSDDIFISTFKQCSHLLKRLDDCPFSYPLDQFLDAWKRNEHLIAYEDEQKKTANKLAPFIYYNTYRFLTELSNYAHDSIKHPEMYDESVDDEDYNNMFENKLYIAGDPEEEIEPAPIEKTGLRLVHSKD